MRISDRYDFNCCNVDGLYGDGVQAVAFVAGAPVCGPVVKVVDPPALPLLLYVPTVLPAAPSFVVLAPVPAEGEDDVAGVPPLLTCCVPLAALATVDAAQLWYCADNPKSCKIPET